jgi:DNA repair exonuclease SbcCD ATPase subunit
MDLFNQPNEFNYEYMNHDLNVDKFENPYIQVVWEDTPDNFTQERIKRVRAYFEKKYNSKNVNVVTKVKVSDDEVQSVDVSMNILDENYQKDLITKYLKIHELSDDEKDILEFNEVVENKVSADKSDITPFKKWYINKIEFSNFLSFGDNQVLDFDKVKGITAVESNPPNFGGKTVLTVDLLLFLFFNTTTKTNKAEEIFNRFRDKDKVSVKGDITIDGENYIIVREVVRKPKRTDDGFTVSTKLDFFKKLADGSLVNFTGEQRRETEEFIKRSIGEMNDFLMTILTTANNLEELIESKPTARGQVLSRFLGLDSLKLKEEAAKEIVSNFSKRMTSNLYNIEDLKSNIETNKEKISEEENNIGTYNNQIKDVNDRIEKGQKYRDEWLQKKHSGIDNDLLRVNPNNLDLEIKSYEFKILNTQKDIDNLNITEPSEYYHEDNHDVVKEQLSDEKIKLGTLQSKKRDIESELKSFEGGIECQYCGIVLAQSEYNEKRKKELDDINIGISHSSIILEGHEKTEKSFVDLKRQFDEYEKNKLIKEKYEIQIESFELKKKSVEETLQRFKDQEVKLNENNKIDEVLMKADMRLDELSREKEMVNSNITTSKNNIEKYKEKIEELNGFIKTIREEEEKLRIYKIYLDLFGKKGISKMIMRGMTPVINSELQRLLMDSAEFKLEVRISEKDEVEFWMVDNNTQIEKLMSSGSGYERTIASLALRAVLSKVCSLPKPNIVVFDEVFGKISNDNLEMVSEFFHKIKSYFEKIFVITHNPMVSQWSDSIVKIQKSNNVSKVIQ